MKVPQRRVPEILEMLLPEVPGPEWRDEANCASTDPELFFPSEGGEHGKLPYVVCDSCTVPRECITTHLDEEYGIFGGAGAKEREKVRQVLGRPKRSGTRGAAAA